LAREKASAQERLYLDPEFASDSLRKHPTVIDPAQHSAQPMCRHVRHHAWLRLKFRSNGRTSNGDARARADRSRGEEA
jgi:hypothetical protein